MEPPSEHSHSTMPALARFCIRCGQPLAEREVAGQRRPVCEACGYIHFDDPKLAVGVVAERDGQILLVRRNHEPGMGRWSFPSGFVDAGEVLEEAAAREVVEETGVRVAVEGLLGAYSRRGERTVFIAYAARVIGGQLLIGPEAMDVGYFPPDALPDLAFPHDLAIVAAWQEYRRSHKLR